MPEVFISVSVCQKQHKMRKQETEEEMLVVEFKNSC